MYSFAELRSVKDQGDSASHRRRGGAGPQAIASLEARPSAAPADSKKDAETALEQAGHCSCTPCPGIQRIHTTAGVHRRNFVAEDVVMTAETSPEAAPIATLGANGAKARFGAAYLRTICSHAGVGFMETTIDEDVLAIDGKIEFAMGDARVQIKCTGQFRIDGGTTASWPAEEAWWLKWHRSKVPVYFVIVMVDPDDQPQWLEHRNDGTLCRTAAFWVRVDQMVEGPSITVPKVQRLTADTLAGWAADVNACFGS